MKSKYEIALEKAIWFFGKRAWDKDEAPLSCVTLCGGYECIKGGCRKAYKDHFLQLACKGEKK